MSIEDKCVCCGEEADSMAMCDRPHCGSCYDIHIELEDDECHCDDSNVVKGHPEI